MSANQDVEAYSYLGTGSSEKKPKISGKYVGCSTELKVARIEIYDHWLIYSNWYQKTRNEMRTLLA
jgi:hypothetical protein